MLMLPTCYVELNFFYLFWLQGCSLVALNHKDVYLSTNEATLILQLEYLADVVIKVEPLATGLATDVHGQVIPSLFGANNTFFGFCAIIILL